MTQCVSRLPQMAQISISRWLLLLILLEPLALHPLKSPFWKWRLAQSFERLGGFQTTVVSTMFDFRSNQSINDETDAFRTKVVIYTGIALADDSFDHDEAF